MIKVGLYDPVNAQTGMPTVVPLFSKKTDGYLEKMAEAELLPSVVQYIKTLRPSNDCQYVLINALGAVEWWGSNANGDAFDQPSLCHFPSNWQHNPLVDAPLGRDWTYGLPTFYGAGAFIHHRNGDHSKRLGGIELVEWHARMKRGELIVRYEKDRCLANGGQPLWDRLSSGELFPTSMGCRVPFDLCSVCTDWPLYHEAEATFDPKKHKHVGVAVLEFHKALLAKGKPGIRGLSPTRKTYCDHAKRQMNRILPSGVKVWVYNPQPFYFDISGVIVGADKTSYAMMKIAGEDRLYFFFEGSGGAELAEKLGYCEDEATTKQASLEPTQEVKQALSKRSEIVKDTPPSFVEPTVRALEAVDPVLSPGVLQRLAGRGLSTALTSSAAMGMVLSPEEFDHVCACCGETHVPQGPLLQSDAFSPLLAALLFSSMTSRSLFRPWVEPRALVIQITQGSPKQDLTKDTETKKTASAHAGLYARYRQELLEFLPEAVNLLPLVGQDELSKLAMEHPLDLFSSLSVGYARTVWGAWAAPTAVASQTHGERGPHPR